MVASADRPGRGRRGDGGDDQEGQAPPGEQPVEEVPGIEAEHDQTDRRHDDQRASGQDGTAPEVGLQVGRAVPAGVGDQEHRGQEGGGGHGQRAEQHRGRVEPRGDRVTSAVAHRDPTGRDAAEGRGEEERREDRGDPEDRGVAAAADPLPGRFAQREPGAAQHQPEPGEDHGDPRGRCDRLEHLREPGPGQDDHEDEPDVVGLPDRRHRVVDQRSGPGAAVRAAGGQVPEAGAVVHPAAAGVRGDRQDQHQGHGVGAAHGRASAAAGSCSPTGSVSRASSASWRRQRSRIRSSRVTNPHAISA